MEILLPAMPLICGVAKVTNYFFLTSLGNASLTGAQDQKPVIYRNTVSRSNSFFICPPTGESVLFKRNEISYVTITINKTGISYNPIEKGTYNTWDKPIIQGLSKNSCTGKKYVYLN